VEFDWPEQEAKFNIANGSDQNLKTGVLAKILTTIMFWSQTSVETSCLERTKVDLGDALTVVASHHAFRTLVSSCTQLHGLMILPRNEYATW